MQKGLEFSKNCDFKKISKEINKYRSLQIKSTKVDNIIFVPYNENIWYNDVDTNKLLIISDIIAKQQTQIWKRTFVIPIININYNTKSVYSSTKWEQILYQKYRNFYQHCKFLWIQFYVSYKKFFEISFHQKVLVYIGNLKTKWILDNTYLVRHWSIASQSVLTEEEIEYREEYVKILYIKFFVEAKKYVILSHIDNPIYFFGIVAILVHPKDKRYKKFIWKNVILPIVNKAIPIVWDDTVDNIKDSWTIALIPWHNSYHLELAKKHNLPTNVFSIDEQWSFTKNSKQFANKDSYDFQWNIIRFLDDIWNLKETRKDIRNIIYEKQTWNTVLEKASSQWIFKLPEFVAYPDIEYNVIPNKSKEEISHLFYSSKQRCVSRQFKNLYQFPLFQDNYWNKCFLDINKIITNYDSKNIQKILLTIFIVLWYLHGYRNDVFSISTIFDICWQKINKKDEKTIWEKLLSYLITISELEKTSKKDFLEIEEYLQKDFVNIKDIEAIIKYFESGFWLKSHNDDIIEVNWSEIFTLQEWEVINIQKNEIYAIDHKLLSTLQTAGIAEDLWHCQNYQLCFDDNSKDNAILLHQYQCSTKDSKNIDIFYVQNQEKINTSIYQYKTLFDWDSIRLFCLFWNSYEFDEMEWYSFLIKKIWNASRYIILNCETKQKELNLEECDIKDKRIIRKFSELTKQYQNYQKKQINTQFLYSVLETVCYDFFDNYMWVSKSKLSENKQLILWLILKQAIQLLFPIVPFISQKLRNIISDKNIYDVQDLNITFEQELDYNFVLCMDIVKIYKKWYYKYQWLDVLQFYLSGNSNIINFMKENIEVLNVIMKRSEIIYISWNNEMPTDCLSVDSIIDMKLWIKIKKVEKENAEISLEEVESYIDQKKQKLQKVREIIQIIQPTELAMKKQYTEQLDILKLEIENLEAKYSKMKFLQKNN